MSKRRNPLPGNITRQIKVWGTSSEDPDLSEARPIVPVADSDVVTSEVQGWMPKTPKGTHKPVLDLDFPAKLIDSSTPGHHHLLIDKELTWHQYVKLLDVMQEVGLLEPGYVSASKERGFTCVRLPWVKKSRPVLPSDETPPPLDDDPRVLPEF